MITAAHVSARLQGIAKQVDQIVEDAVGEKSGFILLVWAGGEVNYVGTDKDRTKVIRAMREIIAKWEAGTPQTPAHERQ